MIQHDQKDDDSDAFESQWNDLPDSIREGFRAEQAMWEEIQAREAELAKPWGLLGYLGYRTNTGCF